jgi:hypothetical protein
MNRSEILNFCKQAISLIEGVLSVIGIFHQLQGHSAEAESSSHTR